MAHNGQSIGDAWASKLFRLNKSTVNEQKKHIMNQKLNKELSLEPQPNSEQKADEKQVNPSIANANVIGCTVPVSEDDWEYDECQPWEDCPKCGRTYDHIDFDYQSCSKCGWDAEKEKFDSEIKREPTEEDFMNGDADLLSGCWL